MNRNENWDKISGNASCHKHKSLKEYELLGDFPQGSLEIETYASKLLPDSGLRAFNEQYFAFTLHNLQGLKARRKA